MFGTTPDPVHALGSAQGGRKVKVMVHRRMMRWIMTQKWGRQPNPIFSTFDWWYVLIWDFLLNSLAIVIRVVEYIST